MRRPATTDMVLPKILRETLVALIRREGVDLTARQFAVFLICYIEEGPHTVRGIAERTRLPKPAVSRVLDRLGALGLTRRVPDPRDKRSIVVTCAEEGFAFLRQVREIMAESAAIVQAQDAEAGSAPGPAAANGG